MTDHPPRGTTHSSGTRALIVGVALTSTGVISEAALIVQLVAYDPSCEPLMAWSFAGACGGLRLLILLMLPFLVAGVFLIALGIVRRLRLRSTLRSG